MKKPKLNLITLLHAYCEQKRENQDLKNLLRDKDATIRELRLQKEFYRRKCKELQHYERICAPITAHADGFMEGWLE